MVCLKEVSEGFGGALANLDDQGWTWDDEYLLASVDLCASHLVGFYLHRRHFAMAPSISKVSLNFGCLFLRNHTVLLDGRHGCWWRDEYVVIIFQFFLNINSIPLHEMKLHQMIKELALRPQYAQYPNPNPKPELFGQTRPEPDPKSKSPTRQGLFSS